MTHLPQLALEDVGKSFTLHLRGGVRLPVLSGLSFTVRRGECVALGGPSGTGKSSVLRMVYGNYRCDEGAIKVRDEGEWVDVASATPRRIIALRRRAMGHVSQFLRVIPRIGALDLVAAAGRDSGLDFEAADARARELLGRLNLPARLWTLPPATFSGGEQQRVNIARGLIGNHPLLLLDEPTASLDARNRAAVIGLARQRRDSGCAVLGVFHDAEVRAALADREIDLGRFTRVVAAEAV
ncbi:MAG: phosphonate C-P lyase system protein PhnL [Acetobacteraceae bacterium]|nr:phosphonate C-P lyase system protein PhnL [Acetobacteraceae bacterium]